MLLNPTKLAGVLGDKTAKAFHAQLGITTVGELLEHYPRRYASRGQLTDFLSLPLGETVSVVGEVASTKVRRMRGRQGTIFEVVLSDGHSDITLAFFNQQWRQKDLIPGVRGLFSGKVGSFSGQLQLAHPDYELFQELDEVAAKAWADLPIPIYKSAGALTTWKIQKAIDIVLDTETTPELFSAELIEEQKLLPLQQAVEKIHRPKTASEHHEARQSLIFHEAMTLHLQLLQQRQILSLTSSEKREPGDLLEAFDSTLGFSLTSGQELVCSEILADLASGAPMHRLLQGEVGSGKTVVAIRTMLAVAQSGGQSALLAPTEVLATQHYQSLRSSLGEEMSKMLGLKLLTGQISAKDRKQVLLDLASGKCLVVVGTHALLSEGVTFLDLGLVVVDEQHRFGVEQRAKLQAKARSAPHVLAMTATPIPRTLAITVFGDLDVSTLTELPAGRKEIKTHVVSLDSPALVARVWKRAHEEIALGRQVFVVCPRIEGEITEAHTEASESDTNLESGPPPASAVEVFLSLQQNKTLQASRIGLMHGRLTNEEKATVMASFAAQELDILVATTVIEVGVNVPNASVMVVLDADRFGISQLHQLRGRVGRGEAPGLCLLVTRAESNSVSMERLTAVASTTDGFKLSELDLEIRGEGDVLGQLQSGGKSSLKILRVVQDSDLIVNLSPLAGELFEGELSPALRELIGKADARGLKQS
ncbi:MAG: ATP-dependent DNA helicase RecG [Aquiluna sp.]|nr:ATP-dependent DNA helicase RecG [Aquiluna sp.]